jgi:P-type E1-E2 ATPase
MIELNIPGHLTLYLKHLVLDVNGTLAVDGVLIAGVAKRIASMRDRLEIHLLTADTHGKQALIDEQLGLTATRIQADNESFQKAAYVHKLGSQSVAAIGQGTNDHLMLKEAALGISILSIEGLNTQTLLASQLIIPDINAALDLFEKPLRLIASLRQ